MSWTKPGYFSFEFLALIRTMLTRCVPSAIAWRSSKCVKNVSWKHAKSELFFSLPSRPPFSPPSCLELSNG